MLKTKPITKNHDYRDQRARQERSERQRSSIFDSESDEDSSNSLQQLDFSRFCTPQEENYSIQNFIENLKSHSTPEFQEQLPSSDQEDFNQQYFSSVDATLEYINARYMKLMASSSQKRSISIKFDPTVSVKYFSSEQPVTDISILQEYTLQAEEHQETSDEERGF